MNYEGLDEPTDFYDDEEDFWASDDIEELATAQTKEQWAADQQKLSIGLDGSLQQVSFEDQKRIAYLELLSNESALMDLMKAHPVEFEKYRIHHRQKNGIDQQVTSKLSEIVKGVV